MVTLKPKFNLNISGLFTKLLTLALSILFIGLAVFIITLGPRPYKGGLQEGEIAKETIRAPFDFFVRGGINEEATRLKKEEAARKVKELYNISSKKLEEALKEISLFFDKAYELISNEKLNQKQKIQALKEESKIELSTTLLNFIVVSKIEYLKDIEDKLYEILKKVMNKAIMLKEDKKKLTETTQYIIIRNEKDGSEDEVLVDSIWTIDEAADYGKRLIKERFVDDINAQKLSIILLNYVITDNLIYNQELTQQRRQKAIDEVSPVYKQIKIRENNIIVAKNQLVTKEHWRFLRKLQEIQNTKEAKSNLKYYHLSIGMFVTILFLLFWAYLKIYEAKIISNNRYLVLFGLLSLIILIISKAISMSFLSSYLIPLASISMLLGILFNFRLAIIMTVFLAVMASLITGEQLGTFLYGLCGGLVGIFSVRSIRRRSQILKSGLLVGVINSVVIIGIDISHNLETLAVLKDSLWGITNGVICAFIVTGILPILEYLFNITTDISLLELSDLNHPLLKEMVIKAPGTYHHSLIVGNLAENAARAIGANPLLARVGAYYHDIGKLIKPEYFNENQMGFNDKHAVLTPEMSSLIITSHVKEGLELAKKYKLCDVIKDFIRQHHGKSLTYYFYQQALEKGSKEGKIDESQFRYPGPLPQTKETAIVLLADSVEAATRSITEPTPTKIKKTVQKIINNKFIDGQLDECDLTLRDLHNISESFSNLLIGIYHSRIEYPESKEEKEEL